MFLMWQAGPNESPQTDASVTLAKTPGGLFCFPATQSFEAEGTCEEREMEL